MLEYQRFSLPASQSFSFLEFLFELAAVRRRFNA